MQNKLPEQFKLRMQNLLKDESQPFLASLEQASTKALRINTNKISVEDFKKISPWPLEPIPWAQTGFIIPQTAAAGKHIYHRAGLYYLQEPSAMIVGEVVDAKKNELVLDLAAAPGGKTSHINATMANTGLLVSNEINYQRARALSENLERIGVKNILQSYQKVSELAKLWGAIFDRVLLDAPCSGEGMFRKSEDARQMWSENNIQTCALRQNELIDDAARLLKTGGYLIYSTCTFAPEENEQVIAKFLDNNPEFKLQDLDYNLSPAKTQWSQSAYPLEKALRLWPHKISGEGHFVAKLQKTSGVNKKIKKNKLPKASKKEATLWLDFLKQNHLKNPVEEASLAIFGEKLFALPEIMLDTNKLNSYKAGLFLGRIKKNRFEPAHSLAMALQDEFFDSEYLDLEPDDPRLAKYLRGDLLELSQAGPKNHLIVSVNKYPVGWVRRSHMSLKNLLPKGLRIN